MNQAKINKIKHQYKILKELHGNTTSDEEMYAIIGKDFYTNIEDVERAVNYQEGSVLPAPKYGIVKGRFQPFHFGHQHIINEVILDGRTPIIIIGDDDGANCEKNPLTVFQRIQLIEQVFPGVCIFIPIKDNTNWTKWFDSIEGKLSEIAPKEDIALFFHNKECDRYDGFECRGKEYFNEFYTEIYLDAGYRLIPVEFVERTDIKVDADARNIRDNFEDFRHLMDGRNYWKLKSWGW